MASTSKQNDFSSSRKVETVVCYKCKTTTDKRDTIPCSICKRRFEFNCVSISEKLYRIMDKDKKQSWKCPICVRKPKKTPNFSFVKSNITTRKKAAKNKSKNTNISLNAEIQPCKSISPPQPKSPISETDINDDSHIVSHASSFDDSCLAGTHNTKISPNAEIQSCKNISPPQPESPTSETDIDDDSHILTQEHASSFDDSCIAATDRLSKSVEHTFDTCSEYELRDEINQLKVKLMSTESELENTILENNTLKRTITKLNKEIHLLKNLCKVPHNMGHLQQNKRHSLPSSPLRNLFVSQIPPNYATPLKAPLLEETKPLSSNYPFLQMKISELNQTLLDAKQEIDSLNKQITNLQNKLRMTNLTVVSNSADLHRPAINSQENEDSISNRSYNGNYRNNEMMTKPTIHIIGDEQLRGLAATFIRTRTGKWNDRYKSSAIILSDASSSEILTYCEQISKTISRDDIVILGFGSHDKDLHKLHSNLCIAINLLAKSTIYVIPINCSPYFNEFKLYKAMKMWTKHFEKCYILEYSNHLKYCNNFHYLNFICNKINLCIDYIEYKLQFLTFKNINNLKLTNCKNNNQTLDFTDIRKKSLTFKNNNNLKLTNCHYNNQTLDFTDIPKKGTIPFYFKRLSSNPTNSVVPAIQGSFFRAQEL